MSTTTTRLGLYKPASDGSENVNVVTDLLNNWDAIDLNFGFRGVTSSTRPSSPFTGQIIRESDTNRTLLWNGSSWVDVYNSEYGLGAISTTTLTAATTNGATAGAFSTSATGTSSTGVVTVTTNATGKRAFDWRVTGDSVSRIRMDTSASNSSGTLTFGDGTTADTNLYRGAANTLATDDSMTVAGTLTVAGQGFPVTYYKTANTDRSATTTFASDPDLTCSMAASSVYLVELNLMAAALDAARFKTQWSVPASATGLRSCIGPDQGAVLSGTSGGQGRWGAHNFTTSTTYGSRDSATNAVGIQETGIVTTSGSGTFALQWAQATSNATATRLAGGSWMRVTKLA